MDWFSEHWPETWLIVAFVLGALEIANTALVLLMLAGGALAAMVAALAGASFMTQVIVGVITSLALLALLRPPLIRYLHSGPTLENGAAALVGSKALVLEDVSSNVPGRVKIGGDVWTARPAHDNELIEAGASVQVDSIKGAIAYVLRSPQADS
jgi:membrane protein implicated in regulation of membrane protease activity